MYSAKLAEMGITEDHPDYDDIMCSLMFGGKNINELYEKINSEYRPNNSKPETSYRPGPDQEHDMRHVC